MTIRKITTNEIQAVGAILQNKDAIELLKKINEQVVTEEDTKGKRKQSNDIFAFQGFAHQDDILGEDTESKEFQEKQGSIKNLVDAGLILEGFHVPLERNNEKKFGDIHLPAPQNKVAKYKITEEGLTLLALVSSSSSSKQQQQQQQSAQTKPAVVKSNNIVPDDAKAKQQTTSAKKVTTTAAATTTAAKKNEKAIASFKEDIKKENKL